MKDYEEKRMDMLDMEKELNWINFLEGELTKTELHFVREEIGYNPSIEDFLNIDEDQMQHSWLSIKGMKSIMLLQQKLKTNDYENN